MGASTKRRELRKLAAYLASIALLSVLVMRSDWRSSAQLHTLMEVVACLMAAFVAVLSLVSFDARRQPAMLYLGAAFGATALLDGYHAVVTSTLFREVVPSPPESLIPWSWYASRAALAILLVIRGMQNAPGVRASAWLARATATTVAFVALASALFFSLVPLPPAHWEGLLGRPQELIVAAIFGVGLVLHLRRPDWAEVPLERGIVFALGVDALLQTSTMTLSHRVFDAPFDLAHALKVISYAHVAWGVAAQTRVAYQKAEQSDALRAATARAEAANEELRSFAYAVSHDLRAPLRSLDGFSSALREDYAAQLDEDGKRYLDHIRTAAQDMSAMLDGLSRLSQVARAELELDDVDLVGICNPILDRLRAESPDRDVEIVLPATLEARGDPALLRVLMQNLLENAWKFTRRVEKPRIVVGVTNDGAGRVFSVADNGAGFDMTHEARLFTAFQRLHKNADFPGTGLGLATVKRIVSRHGGRVWAQGAPNQGASVFFTLGEQG